ncbi:MAG TPA: GNAT family N-acetyltransferase [Terriglobales bacterium]
MTSAIQVDLSDRRVITPRLQLTPATVASLEAELRHDYAALAGLLSATVPSSWPPDLYDDDARRYSLAKLREFPEHADWWTWYILLRQPGRKPDLVGVGGFKGPPRTGVVEIGYGVVKDYQRCGIATEAAAGLVRWAHAHPHISMVAAHTLPELIASIRVLEKNGFVQRGTPEEEGAIRFELDLPASPG